jgi:hypothetical protein
MQLGVYDAHVSSYYTFTTPKVSTVTKHDINNETDCT